MKVPSYLGSKISDAYLQQAQAARRKEGRARSASALRRVKKDEIVLSPRAAEIREFEELAKAVPEERWDKIEAIKTQIESKTYTVNGKLVAKSIAELLS